MVFSSGKPGSAVSSTIIPNGNMQFSNSNYCAQPYVTMTNINSADTVNAKPPPGQTPSDVLRILHETNNFVMQGEL